MSKVYLLPEILTINHIDSLLSDFHDIEVGDDAIGVMDGGQVKQISTPAAQLLIAFQHTLDLLDGALKLVNPSPELIAGFQRLGLSELLNKWSNTNA